MNVSAEVPISTSDVVVLGGGPGGYSAALRAADLGLSVSLIEDRDVGGTCLHRGCVPTRAMLHAASLADGAGAPAARWGIHAEVKSIDFERLLQARNDVVARNARAVEGHLRRAGVRSIRGRGTLLDDRCVVVDGARYTASRGVVLATGSRPRQLRLHEFDGKQVLSSDDALQLHRVPSSMILLGGGAIGAEMSQVWRALGADVTLVERMDRLVPSEDASVGRGLERALRRRGIQVRTNAHLVEVATGEEEVRLTFDRNGSEEHFQAEMAVVAIGRVPSTDGIGLEDAGVARDEEGYVQIGDWSCLGTSVPGIHAVGDVVPSPSQGRAHVAFAEGLLVADHLGGNHVRGIDYDQVPRITHGIIETACVGLSQEEAQRRGLQVDVVEMPLGAIAKGAILGEGGSLKLVSEHDGTVLGAHLVGPHVSELVGEATAITSFEASVSDFATLIHGHPTLSEAFGEVDLRLAGRPLHLR